MARRLTVGMVLVALAVPAVVLAVSGPVVGSGSGPGIDGPPQTTPSGFNNTAFRVHVFENGSTKWTVQHSTPLETPDEVDQFETYAETFRSEETDIFRNFKWRAQRLTAAGTNVTGREMNASGFSRDARIDRLGQDRGIIELSFWWSNFTRSEGQRLVVDDVFSGGMYLGTGQRLVFARGPNLSFARVEPRPDSPVSLNLSTTETVTWFGERQFADRRPAVEFAPTGVSQNGGQVSDETPTPTPVSAVGGGVGPVPIALLLLVVIGIAGGLLWYRGDLQLDEGGASTEQRSRPDAETARPDAVESDAGASGVSEEEFLSDEERVVRLLEEHDGRMKQVNIVENTDWSKSKVSMLLSDMEDEGTISKLRVGRENIVSLAGEEPDAVGSPFDDE